MRLETSTMKPGQVLVRMLAAPITASDLSAIAGFGAEKGLVLPRVAGNEGVGVVEVAAGGLKKGDVVVASRPGLGESPSPIVYYYYY